jgi:hypothetical protein
MSGMADEIQRRMEADGALRDADAAPGTGDGGQPAPASPPAGELNADTGAGGGTPDTIPYSRFKEVNDRYAELRGFEQLREYGYDPDSLGRLAAFEAQYLQDPIGTWRSMADNLDLPEPLKQALEQHLEAQASGDGAQGEPPAPAQTAPELPKEVQDRLDYVKQLQERDEERAREEQLSRVTGHWDELDKKDGIETPERIKLMAISAMAGSGSETQAVV